MARDRGTSALAAVTSTGGAVSAATQRMRVPTNGPHDADLLDAEFTAPKGTVDFGAVRVPVPAEGSVTVEPSSAGRMQAVHVSVPEGRLSVSALAAPRNGGLWPDLATEIHASLREGGARVRSFSGEWGRELHATTDGATSVFVGVDGPTWMLYGVATGPTRDAVALDARLRRMLRGTVVVRGKAPYPVRTVLPLTAQTQVDGDGEVGTAAPPTMTLRTSLAIGAGSDGAAAVGVPGGAASTSAPMNRATPTGPSSYGVGVNGAAPHSADPTRELGSPPGLWGSGTNGHRAATNGVTPDTPAGPGGYPPGSGTGGGPATRPAVNGWTPTGAHPTDAGPELGPAANGAGTHAANGASTHGVPPFAAANGASTYGVPPFAGSPGGTGAYGVPPVGSAPDASAYGAGPYAAPPSGPATRGVSINAESPFGVAANGAAQWGPSAGGAVPDGAGSGGFRAAGPAATGGHSRPGVPAGWAHETGGHRRGSVTEPPAVAASPVPPDPSGRPWVAPAPDAAPPTFAGAEPVGPTSPAPPRRLSVPVEPAPDWRPSWADPDLHVAEPAPASAPSNWDPLFGPLAGGLDPLPEPDPVWSDVAAGPSRRRPTEPVGADALPDAGMPKFDGAPASGGRSRPADLGGRAAPSDAGTPLFDAASASSGSRRAVERARPDAGTPLFDAASASTGSRRAVERGRPDAPDAASASARWRRSADRGRAVPSDGGTLFGDSGSSPGASPRSAQPVRHAASPGTSRPDLAAEPGGRRRRDTGGDPLPRRGTSDPARRARRHQQEPGDEPFSAVRPSSDGAEGPRPGRRRAQEALQATAGRHDAMTVGGRHGDDAQARHADAGSRHSAQHGPAPRVPPTQWAWPKEPVSVDAGSDAPTGRRAADSGPASWSAAGLLETPGHGGRRRRSEAARHGHSDDVEPGRHHRP